MVITTEDLFASRRQTLKKVFKFIGVDDSFCSKRYITMIHKSSLKRRNNRIDVFLARTIGKNFLQKFPYGIRGKAETLLYYPFSHKIQRPTLNDRLRQGLIDYLKDDINSLRECTGHDFDDWCV